VRESSKKLGLNLTLCSPIFHNLLFISLKQMSREFKKGKVKEAGADNLNKSYHIVEMGASYPFG
jgi:hypothetical protein